MTIVEFFDKDAIENLISSLLCKPQNIILIGDKYDTMKKASEKYKAVIEKHGINVNFSIISVPRNELQKIVNELEQLLEKHNEITIDLTGGEDLYLVAAGIVYHNNPEKVHLHRFNLNSGALYDCDADGNVLNTTRCDISVEDNLAIYGGRIIYENTENESAEIFKWDFNDDFKADIDKMWKICTEDSKEWNHIMTTCSATDKKDDTNMQVVYNGRRYTSEPETIKKLRQQKLIYNVKISPYNMSFCCKNAQIKRCIITAGQLLEVKTTTSLMKINDANNGKSFNDILTGVKIQWELAPNNNSMLTNEIDVLLIKDLVPIFISCKNGKVDIEELYKLSTVAAKFGGKYAKKILISTENWALASQRANELDIRLIDNVKDCADLSKKFKNLLKPCSFVTK